MLVGVGSIEIIGLGLLIACVVLWLFGRKRKKQPWRIAKSRKWLQEFRQNKRGFNEMQRFSYLRKIDHFLWEEIIMSCFEERGYWIERTKMTRDGGSDGFVSIDGEMVVIQAKRYKGAISKEHVKELIMLVNRSPRLKKGLFIHTGTTSEPIKEIIKTNDEIAMISGIRPILDFLDGKPIFLFGKKINKTKKA